VKTWFITGTDTGVGKTTVAVALLEEAARQNLSTAAMKPAESGCPTGPDGQLVPEDARKLQAACTQQLDLDLVCPYRFAEPVAPGVAAERTGQGLDPAVILDRWRTLQSSCPDLLVAEGAGGLLVPMGSGRMVADLARALGAPLLIVARESLGTINHTLLTIEAAEARGLAIDAVILNPADGPTPEATVRSNAREIERASDARVVWGPGAVVHLIDLILRPSRLRPRAARTAGGDVSRGTARDPRSGPPTGCFT
jgi:dethiobiotin synthetase